MNDLVLEPTLSAFYRWEKESATKTFLRQPYGNDWKEYSWQEVGQQARKMASHLKATLPANSKVAILSLNCAHWFMADLAIMMAGHISVPIYPTAGKDTIKTILEHSEAELVFLGKLWDWDAKKSAVSDEINKIGFFQPYEGIASWEEIVAQAKPMAESPVPDFDDLASIIYTSGTTGMPKGVMTSYRALANGAAAAAKYVHIENEHFFSYLPLAHCAERELVEIISIHTGSVVSFTESLDTFQTNIQSVQPTVFLGVPRIWLKFQQGIEQKVGKTKLAVLLKIPFINNLIRKKIITGLGLNKVKIPLSGAAALPVATINFFEKLGLNICEAYGLTETLAFSHANIPELREKGSVGRPMPSANIKIAESGEVLLKSPCIMQGYYKEPLKTEDVMADDGYFRTGDLGSISDAGFLHITGRVKDIYKTSKGKYVSPIPIESKLEPELGVEFLCVIGDGLPSSVCVASTHGMNISNKEAYTIEAQGLLSKLNNQLEKHEQVKMIIFVADEWNADNGLITPTMKIRRPQIEEKYAELIDSNRRKDELVIWA